MADYSAQDLLKQAVLATRQQNLPAARKLIQASIRKDANNATAWLVYASIAETKREKLLCLKRTLELDPNNAQAAKMAQDMGVTPEQLTGEAPKAAPPPPEQPKPTAPVPSLFSFQQDDEPEEEADTDFLTYREETITPPPQADEVDVLRDDFDDEPADEAVAEPAPAQLPQAPQSVEPPRPAPRPDSFEERLKQSSAQAGTIVEEFLTPAPPPDGVEWVKKEKNRAGENEIVAVRAAVITSLATFIGVPLIIIGVVLYNTPFVRALVDPNQSISAFTGSTLTPTPTPPTTPTNTPGFTPTSSVTPTPIPTEEPSLTPTPTVLSELVRGNPDINFIEPTEIVVPGGVINQLVSDGIELILNEGDAENAIPPLATERGSYETAPSTFDARVFYTEAFALARLGEFEDAFEILGVAETLEEETNQESTLPRGVIFTGYARVYFEQGKQQREAGNNAGATQSFTQAERNAQEAIDLIPDSDADWAEPRLILVQSRIELNNLQGALTAIEEALAVPALRNDVRFYVLRGEILLQQEELVEADYTAFVALFIDPVSAEAHDLRTRIALAHEDASLASLYAQTYLYYHPLVVAGWEMLGDARMLEGNTNLALEAYTQAIVVGENTDEPAAVDAYIQRANIYEQRGQYELAALDVAAAAAATDNPDYQRRQLYLMFEAGFYLEAREFAEELVSSDVIPQGEADFIEARALLATKEDPTVGDYEDVSRWIDGGFANIPDEYQPLANRIRAEAYLAQGEPETALNHALNSLAAEESAQTRLLLGNIYNALEQFPQAVAEFQQVLTLDQLVSVPDELVAAAREGINNAANLQAEAEATAQAD